MWPVLMKDEVIAILLIHLYNWFRPGVKWKPSPRVWKLFGRIPIPVEGDVMTVRICTLMRAVAESHPESTLLMA